MSSEAGKRVACVLLMINIALYFIVVTVAAWAVSHGIEKSTKHPIYVLKPPAQIFPIYFPIGNMATGYVVILTLLAGIVGFAASATGFANVIRADLPNLNAAAASSSVSCLLTLLALGIACKEINLGWTEANLRTLEVLMIIVAGSQIFCTAAIHYSLKKAARGTGFS